MNNPIEIYQSADGQTQVEVRFDTDTVWLSQAQMVTLFGRNQSVISRHINNAIAEGEINEKSNMQKMHIASADRPVTFYDLETIISVGYRIKSAQGIASVSYTHDEGLLQEPAGENGGSLPTPEAARRALSQLKAELIARGEASDLFAREREDGLAAILGNLAQSVFGAPAYPSIESKAAHLLYFIVKNHPFADGNKRSGAFLFVDFLHQNRRLFNADGHAVINDTGLAALTLLVAESAPAQKDTLIRLIMHMLQHHPNP